MYNEMTKSDMAANLASGQQMSVPSVPEQLQSRKKSLESQLEEVNKAIALFEKFPYMAEAFTLLRRII